MSISKSISFANAIHVIFPATITGLFFNTYNENDGDLLFLLFENKYVLMIITVLLYMIFFLVILYYKKIKSETIKVIIPNPFVNSKSRIAIFLPISCKEGYANEDLKLMAEGFGNGTSDFFFNTNTELSESFELVFIDSNTKEKAFEKLEQEIKLGTKYFISTLSSFSLELSKKFNSIDTNSILINTVSGSVNIAEVPNKIYNFYPNSKMEIDKIIKSLTDSKFTKPYIYCYKSTFTQECKTYFISRWNVLKDITLYLSSVSNSFDFMNKRDFDDNHPGFINEKVKESDCIIILGYGGSFFDLINKLKIANINIDSKSIFTISTFRYRNWIKEEADTINGLNIFTVRPKMKSEKFKIETDIVKYFSEQSLDRLLRTIEEINKNNTIFDVAWKNTCPRRLDLDTNQNLQVETIKIV
jgi:hypothetical protein